VIGAYISNPRRFMVQIESSAKLTLANENQSQKVTIAFDLTPQGLFRAKVLAEEINKLISQMKFHGVGEKE
jgi:hypothetical protein